MTRARDAGKTQAGGLESAGFGTHVFSSFMVGDLTHKNVKHLNSQPGSKELDLNAEQSGFCHNVTIIS